MANKLTQVIDELIDDTEAKEASKPKGPFKATVVNPNEDGNQHIKAALKTEGEIEEVVRTPSTKKQGITDWRIVSVAGKNYRFNRHDPYGFWYIVPEKGQLPENLRGSFTSPFEAQKALEIYANKQ